MKKVLNFGKINFENKGNTNLVTVEMEYKSNETLSICANVWNSRGSEIIRNGQCLDTIFPYLKENEQYRTIYRLWSLYHLNDMHAECQHQHALGWHKIAQEEIIIYKWKLKPETIQKQSEITNTAIKSLKEGKTVSLTNEERFILSLEYSIDTDKKTLDSVISKYYKPSSFCGKDNHIEIRQKGTTDEKKHPLGILDKKCPVCGYKYGTAWNFFAIPEEDKKLIVSILNNQEEHLCQKRYKHKELSLLHYQGIKTLLDKM